MSLPGPVICIVGPTASGKSGLSELVAARLGTSVVSVDSMQVYRGMDIGTAKTPVGERSCPLLMVDLCDPCESYSVQRFQLDARACVDGLLGEGRVPVLCGGTGLYLDAVIDEMDFPKGEVGGDRRDRYEDFLKEQGASALYELLRQRDSESASLIHPNNTRRVIRALEMLDEGVSYAKQHEGLKRRAAHYDALVWGLTMDRERLYKRIDARVDDMVADGLVDEVTRLRERGLVADSTAGQAIGYKEVIECLDGQCSLEEAVDTIKRRTRNYAKRQLSWLRRDGRTRWLDMDELTSEEACEKVVGSAHEEMTIRGQV